MIIALCIFSFVFVTGITVLVVLANHKSSRRKFIEQFAPEQREFARYLWDSDHR